MRTQSIEMCDVALERSSNASTIRSPVLPVIGPRKITHQPQHTTVTTSFNIHFFLLHLIPNLNPTCVCSNNYNSPELMILCLVYEILCYHKKSMLLHKHTPHKFHFIDQPQVRIPIFCSVVRSHIISSILNTHIRPLSTIIGLVFRFARSLITFNIMDGPNISISYHLISPGRWFHVHVCKSHDRWSARQFILPLVYCRCAVILRNR